MNIITFHPISSWQIEGETMETVRDFIFRGFKITADDDCSHEIKTRLLFGKKVIGKPRQYIKTQRHYFANKVSSKLWFFQ